MSRSGVTVEAIQFLGLCSYQVTEFAEIVLGGMSCGTCIADEVPFVNEIASDSLRIEPDLRVQRLISNVCYRKGSLTQPTGGIRL